MTRPLAPRFLATLSVGALLVLAACDQQAEETDTGDENGSTPTEEVASVEDPTPEAEQAAEDAPTDLTPTEQAPDAVTQAAETLTTIAVDQINQITDGQPVEQVAQDMVDQAREQLTGQADNAADTLTALVGEVASQVEQAAEAVQDEVAARTEVDWQSSYSAEVPFYNLSDQPVSAFSEAGGVGDVIGTVAPGGGGFIETCNATLDWCLIPFGDEGQRGWVAMDAFGGVAN
ncbi:MAG: hypothetical protein ACFB01_13465 [Cohaesibacteraceae bacterium]